MNLSIGEMQDYQYRMLKIVTEVCESNNIPYLLHSGNLLGAIRHKGPIPWCTDTDILVPEHKVDEFYKHVKGALAPDFWIDHYKTDEKSRRQFARIGIAGYETLICHLDVFRLVGMPDNHEAQLKMYKQARRVSTILAIKQRKRSYTPLKTAILYACKPVAFFIPYKYLLNKFDEMCNRYPYQQATYAGCLSSRHGIKNIFRREDFDDYVMVKYGDLDVRVVRKYHEYLTQFYGDYMSMPPEEEQQRIIERSYPVMKR